MILKLVPRDHVDQLPVPKRIKDYLKTPNYYSENIEDTDEESAKNMNPNPDTNDAETLNSQPNLYSDENEVVED